MKIALVHDYLLRLGGAERVLLKLKEIFPGAEIFTLFYNKEIMEKYFKGAKINVSFLNSLPFSNKIYRYLAPLMPLAVESFNLRDFDLVISSSTSFSKGLIVRSQSIHLNYCHAPSRWLWDYYHNYEAGFWGRWLFHFLRIWDYSVSKRPDYYIANSKATALKIKKYYRREAKVIYPPVGETSPPVNENRIKNYESRIMNNNFFLIVSQLAPYKRIDLAVEAFNKLELPLVIIGDGREKKRLLKRARSNIQFLGWQPDEVVQEHYRNCLAFIFPGEDDFGIAPVEAMRSGKPVLAYRKGGVLETVLEGVSGEFFDEPEVESLADGIRRLIRNKENYSPLLIQKRAEKFNVDRFEKEIREFVETIVATERKW